MFLHESKSEFREWSVDIPIECAGDLLTQWRERGKDSASTTAMAQDDCRHAAIRAFLAADSAAAKAGGLKMALGENGMGVSGNLGWHSGTYTMANAAGTTVDTGKWVETWRKADGKWHIIRDIWNSDAAPAEPAK